MLKSFREVIRDIKEGEVWESNTTEIKCSTKDCVIVKDLNMWKNADMNKLTSNMIAFNLNSSYKLKQQPVAFEEVLNSDKRCRVEHELVDYKEYIGFSLIMFNLAEEFGDVELQDIIKKGKWYLES